MPPLAKIQTKKVSLDELLQNSATIQLLPESERKKCIERIKSLPKEDQRKVAEVLLEEQTKLETLEEEARQKTKTIVEETQKSMEEGKQKFTKTVRKKSEQTERAQEQQTQEALLKELENT